MIETKNGDYDVGDEFHVPLPGGMGAHMRSPGLRSKPQGLIDRKSGKVNVIFRTILDVATEVFFEVLWGNRVIIDAPFNGTVLFPQVR
jgi:hypothetical protein